MQKLQTAQSQGNNNDMTVKRDLSDEEYVVFIGDVRPLRERHWMSIYHQISVPTCLPDVNTVLEFGPGRGLAGTIYKYMGLDYYSSDVVDMGAKPDFMHSIQDFPDDKKFDLVCAFQALEHNPPEDFVPHLKKMGEIANKYVFVSLPYYGRWFSFNLSLNVPRINKNFSWAVVTERFFKKPRTVEKYRKSETPYSHHWFEVGDKGFSKKEVKEMAAEVGLKQIKAFHSNSFPYHYFILFEKV